MYTYYVKSQTIKYCVYGVYTTQGYNAICILLYICVYSDILSSFEKVIIMMLIVLEYIYSTLFIYMVVEVHIMRARWCGVYIYK